MSVHEANVHISQDTFDRVNCLLSIKSLEELSDVELQNFGANTCQCEGIFHVKFDDGSTMNFDLCSDEYNYWDDVVWTSSDGSDDIILECEFELDSIEVEIGQDTYIVNVLVDIEKSRCKKE